MRGGGRTRRRRTRRRSLSANLDDLGHRGVDDLAGNLLLGHLLAVLKDDGPGFLVDAVDTLSDDLDLALGQAGVLDLLGGEGHGDTTLLRLLVNHRQGNLHAIGKRSTQTRVNDIARINLDLRRLEGVGNGSNRGNLLSLATDSDRDILSRLHREGQPGARDIQRTRHRHEVVRI